MANPVDLTALIEGSDSNPGACDGSVIPVNKLDDHIRYTRQVLKGNIGVEHDLGTGQHAFKRGATANRPASPAAGTRYVNTDLGYAEIWDGAAWQPESTVIPSGGTVVMLFRMAAPPVGWTRVVDAGKTDSVIRILLNNEVLADGGSWTVSGLTMQNHTHVATAHQHEQAGISYGNDGVVRFLYENAYGLGVAVSSTAAPGGPSVIASNHLLTSSAGGVATAGPSNNNVASDGTWRPKAVDVIAASKN